MPQRCSTIAWTSVNAIRINISLFKLCNYKSFLAFCWRVLRGSKITSMSQKSIGRIRYQTVSPPVLKCANIIMVVIGNSIPHLTKRIRTGRYIRPLSNSLLNINISQFNTIRDQPQCCRLWFITINPLKFMTGFWIPLFLS